MSTTAPERKTRSQHRGVVLALHEAAAIHRMLEFWYIDRRFDNPIIAMETQAAACEAMYSLGAKLIRQFTEASQ
jgi:hypothetical protein